LPAGEVLQIDWNQVRVYLMQKTVEGLSNLHHSLLLKLNWSKQQCIYCVCRWTI